MFKIKFDKKIWIKLLSSFIALIIVVLINFILPRIMPGDSVLMLTGMDERGVSKEQYEIYKEELGFNKSLPLQFKDYVNSLLKGDLGYSYHYKEGVSSLIAKRIPTTLLISLPAFLISGVLAVVLGLSCGYEKNSPLDKIVTWVMLVASAIPSFLVGMLLVWFFGFRLDILPLGGLSGPVVTSGINFVADRIIHLILPITMVVIASLPHKYLLVRSGAADFKDSKTVVYARARGVSKRRIKYIHIFKNTGQPFIAGLGISFGRILSGSMICESIFSIKGMGQLMYQSIMFRDYPTMQGCLTVTAFWIVMATIITDIIIALLDPKVRCKAYD